MHIINDFFLLTWNQKESSQVVFDEEITSKLSYNFTHDVERFCDSVAIVLIIHPANIEAIGTLESSKQILNHLFTELAFTKENVQKAQKTVLHFLIEHGNLSINKAITERFEHLRKEEILSYDIARRLMSLLSLIEEKKELIVVEKELLPALVKEGFDYHTEVNDRVTLAKILLNIVQDNRLEEKIHDAISRMCNATFSIGVTGVMNAGKSTMLNALLGQEVLGTAVVPETANLTLLRYAKEPSACVNFWTQAEWDAIEQSASSLSSMEAFVRETKEHFGAQFSTFITEEGKSESVALESLRHYTSAKSSDKKCNLVKSVSLNTNLALLENGVMIVDTPGLDDPVIQREEITLQYLNECDVLIHLMNAAQAATQKDVDFILDALLYRKVAQLLIVITRIDAISESELQEVIAYTKQSISKRLEEHNKSALLDDVIAKLSFIPIAGKLALWHKLGEAQKALALGYSLEKTGMPRLESYLHELLFGQESAKAKITLASNSKELEHVAFTCKETLLQSLALLSLSHDEIEAKQASFVIEKQSVEASLEKFLQAMQVLKEEMQHYFKTLRLFADNKADALGKLLYRRIVDDVRYELSKYKRLPKEERIAYMVEVGFKEGTLDLIRDYRYEFQKKIERSLENLQRYYDAFVPQNSQNEFDAKAFCEAYFSKAMVFKNSTVVCTNINRAIAQDAKKEGTVLERSVETLLTKEVGELKQTLWQTLSLLNERLLEQFIASIQAPATRIQADIERKGMMLQEALGCLSATRDDATMQTQALQERLKEVENVIEALQKRREICAY